MQFPIPESAPAQSVASRLIPRAKAQLYRVRLARDAGEVMAAQALRFTVFNIEMNEGLDGSFASGLDADRFDDVCDHLLVEELETGVIAGTYRMQTGTMAAAGLGYYSSQEFDFTPYEPFRRQIVELGRACVQKRHRNLVVLGLLWKGIAQYAAENGCRYLLGCSSLSETEAAVGMRAYEDLKHGCLAPKDWLTMPLPAFSCSHEIPAGQKAKIPKLMSAYFSLGAKICGPPALDREFKTVDFLTVLDLQAIPDALMERYID